MKAKSKKETKRSSKLDESWLLTTQEVRQANTGSLASIQSRMQVR